MDIIKYYGSDETKTEFINHDSEPLMAVIAHDRSHAVVSLLDEGCEHHLLLAKALDKYNFEFDLLKIGYFDKLITILLTLTKSK